MAEVTHCCHFQYHRGRIRGRIALIGRFVLKIVQYSTATNNINQKYNGPEYHILNFNKWVGT